MDYGKMAYLKAEELEGRISVNTRRLPASASFAPSVPLRAPYRIAEIKGTGGIAVMVKLTLYAATAVDGRIAASLNGVTFADCRVTFTGTHSEVLLGAAELSGGAILALEPSGLAAARLERAEVVTIGGDGVGKEVSDFAVAESGGHVLAVFGRSMSVIGRPIADGALGDEHVLGRGNALDACGCPDGYYLVYDDPLGNLWVKRLDATLQETATAYAGRDVTSPAVFADGDGVYLAFVQDGEVYVRTCTADLRFVGEPVAAGFGYADGVAFVRGAPTPMLIVQSRGKCYLKTAESGERTDGTVGFAAACTLEGIDV